MRVMVGKSDVKGTVAVPTSKSLTIRALMCAALSRGESSITDPLVSEDTEAAARVLGQLGATIRKSGNVWQVTGGSLHASDKELHCGESATTLRFITAICAVIPGKHRIVGGPSLSRRPVKSLVESLRKLGVKADIEGKTTPPVNIEGDTLNGGLTPMPGNISSQFISGVMLAAPLTRQGISIRLVTPLTSRPYVLMTIAMLRKFGVSVKSQVDRFVIPPQHYKPVNVTIEGDWSSASYFLALGAASGDGITVDNLSTSSLQGDRVLLDHLRSMRAGVRMEGNAVTVTGKPLRAIHADMTDCIDLLPTMACLGAIANGTTVLTGIERARIKESNRVAAVRQGLERLGVEVTETQDRMTITGLSTVKQVQESYGDAEKEITIEEHEPVLIDSFDDHRIAMAFGMLGAVVGGEICNNVQVPKPIIDRAECVAKTFPGFWDRLESLGVNMERYE